MAQLKPAGDEGFLEAEIRDWIQDRSGYTFEDPNDWLSELDNGVVLCKVLEGIDPGLKPKYKAKPMGIWGKRDNLSNFLDILKDKLEIDTVVLFEITDLLPQENASEGANPDNVVSCLHTLAKIAYQRYGTELPGSTKAEMEIEAEEELGNDDIERIIQQAAVEPQTPLSEQTETFEKKEESEAPEEVESVTTEPKPVSKKYKSVKGDEIDEAVGEAIKTRAAVDADASLAGARVVRIKKGQYLLMPQKKVFYMRILRGQLMVRVGGGWETFSQWLDHLKQFSASHFSSKATTNAADQRVVDVEKSKAKDAPVTAGAPAREPESAPATAVKSKAPMTRKELSRSLSERTGQRTGLGGSMKKQPTGPHSGASTPRKVATRNTMKTTVARQQSQMGRNLSERPASNSMMAERKALKEGKPPHQLSTRRGVSPGRPARTTSPMVGERRSASPGRGIGNGQTLGINSTVRNTSPKRRQSAPALSNSVRSKKQAVKPAPKVVPSSAKPRTPATRRTKGGLSGTVKSTSSSLSAQHPKPTRPSLARSHSLRGGARC
eukprot:TRINITY_DN2067_c0_g2_i1.p1 TRINITY_DN2067_c0_g2~~TRINITY_DN2067_c0_g2_i1.p1  ORF type:complete len:571 (+),score=122.31 TRINITY_DN2067_c0_g2_i1:65-1714(+)